MKLEQLDVFASPFSNKCKTVSWLRSSDLAKKKNFKLGGKQKLKKSTFIYTISVTGNDGKSQQISKKKKWTV